MENSIEDRIEEKYTRYLNCKTDTLELTIEEAIFIVETDKEAQYVEILLQEAYKVILSDYKRVLKENEQLITEVNSLKKDNEELKSENSRLKVIRCSTEYGTENIHLITKSDLVQIDINKYMIEIEDGKFVDLKQVYQENEELRISNKEIDKECSRLEEKEVELINQNEHYKDLIHALETLL